MAGTPGERPKEVIDEPPPFLGRWPRVYILVICWLAVVLSLFYVFSRAFLP
jgi:hypothetical protein